MSPQTIGMWSKYAEFIYLCWFAIFISLYTKSIHVTEAYCDTVITFMDPVLLNWCHTQKCTILLQLRTLCRENICQKSITNYKANLCIKIIIKDLQESQSFYFLLYQYLDKLEATHIILILISLADIDVCLLTFLIHTFSQN